MTWFFLALMAAATSAVFSLIQRRFSRDQAHFDDVVTAQSFQFASALLFFGCAFLLGLPLLPKIPILNILILGIGYGIGSLAMFASLKRLPANVAVILQSTSVIWTAVFATLFLRQQFTALTGAALLCIVAAVALVSYTPQRGHMIENRAGTKYGLLSGLFFWDWHGKRCRHTQSATHQRAFVLGYRLCRTWHFFARGRCAQNTPIRHGLATRRIC